MSEVMSRKSFFEGIDTTTIQKTTLNNKNEPVANGVSKSEQHSNNDRLLKKFNVINKSDRNNTNLENNKNINTENHTSSTMVEKVNDEQNESDSDFKYGPGFVTKLKSRYLSLTLRQSTINKQRPSLNQFLRRTTSLNNLLDEEEIVQGDIDDDEEEEGGLKDNEENKNTNKTYNIINSGSNNNNNNKVVHAFHDNNQNKYNDTKGNGIDKSLLESYPPPADSHHHHRIGRSNEKSDNRMNLKRARSVEAILRYDHSAWERDVEKEHIDNARDDEPHIYVKGPKDITIEDKIQSAKERNGDKKPKRLTSLIDEDERPPHEIVKQTLRIFEASANRKRNPQTRPIGNEIAGKVATFKSKMSGQQQPINEHHKPTVLQLKKPNIIPRTTSPIVTTNNNNLNQINNTKNFNHCANNNEKYAKFTKEKATLPKLDINIIKNNLESKTNGSNHQNINDEMEMGYRNIKLDYSSANSDSSISTPNILSPYRNSMSPQLFDNNQQQQQQQQQNEQKPALLKKPTASSFEPSSPMISFLSSKLNNIHVESSTPKTYSKSSNLLLKSDDKDTTCVDNELEDALNSSPILSRNDNKIIHTYNNSQNNMLELTSNESNDSFNADIDGGHNDHNGESSDVVKSANETVVDGASSPKTINIIQKINNITNNGNNNNNNNNNINNNNVMKVTHEKMNTENEVKSFVMKSSPPLPPTKMRELEKNLINTEKNGNGVNQAEESGLASALPKWTVKKKTWSQQPEQDNTIVFNFSDRKDVPDYIEHDGIILRRKRELPKPHESGFVLLGDLTLDSSTDNDDAYQMGPPSPCDVEFENANIIIDGKSSIRTKAKEVKFKIQFDDSLTRTFEYASETSLLVDDGTEEEDEVDGNFYKNAAGNGAQSKLMTSVPLGGAPFANYTSVKTSGAGFELGVTRPSSASSEEFTQPINNTFDDPEYLKPATDDETVVWSSEGTRATDLLF